MPAASDWVHDFLKKNKGRCNSKLRSKRNNIVSDFPKRTLSLSTHPRQKTSLNSK
ncbi:MAG: hypothetical protein ACI85O_002066 [Saprospiraceae bacterium]|jgi:hypothetical protein